MKDINLKYYKPKALIMLITLLFVAVFYMNYLIKIEDGLLSALLKTAFSIGVYVSLLALLSKTKHPLAFRLLTNIPNINGTYTGQLISGKEIYSELIEDENKTENIPRITKKIKGTIRQNLNGYQVKLEFYNEGEEIHTSSSTSTTHDIRLNKSNEYEICLLYTSPSPRDA